MPLALRTRLALVFATGFAVLMGLGALGLFLHLGRSYRRDFDHGLHDAAAGAKGLFQNDRAEFDGSMATATHIVSELVYGDRTILAFDTAGHFLATTQRFPNEPWFNDAPATSAPNHPATLHLREGPARVLRAPLDSETQLVIAMSLLPLERQLGRLRRSLITILPLILVLGALIGSWGARLVLRPIVAVAGSADRVGQQVAAGVTTFERLPQHGAGDEISILTNAFNRLIDRLGPALASEREAATRQRQFLADAAHELRTPIAILLSEAEVALRGGPDGGADRAALERIGTEARELSSLVNDLMLIARRDAHGITPARERVYLDDLVNLALSRIRTLPAAAGREIRRGNFEAAPALGDATLLERAILVLVQNALLHAPGAPVEVSTGTADGGWAWMTVRDWGPGIPQGSAERIFDRFARLNVVVPGSGLGLPIARAIAEAHGGTLTLDPVSPGAAFTLRLPPATGSAGSQQ